MPGIKNNLFVGLVRVNRRDHALDRVVAKDRTDSNLHAELKLVALGGKLTEKGLVLSHRLALIVENSPAATNPTRIDDRPFVRNRAGFGLDLPLNFTAKSIGIAEGDLKFGCLITRQSADMR